MNSNKPPDDLTGHQTGCTMQNKKRLVLTITKVKTEKGKEYFAISNNQGEHPIWMHTPDSAPVINKRDQWQPQKYEFVRKVRAFLKDCHFSDINFESLRVEFNQEYYLMSSPPGERETFWLDFKIPLSPEEIAFFHNAFLELRTLDLKESGIPWDAIYS